jgi:hypothetical protein
MDEKLPTEVLKVAMQKRILNEFGAKILNEERLDKMVRSRREERVSPHINVTFFCECDSESCAETISLSTEEYEKVHSKTKHFIVVPSHVRLDLEEIISSFTTYAQVGKFFPRPSRNQAKGGLDAS